MINEQLLSKLSFLKPEQSTTKIGLDWGFSSLKIAVLDNQEGGYLLKDARIIQLPSRDLKLSSLIKNLDLSGGVNLGICGPNVVVRYIIMSKLREEEFKGALRYEAASHLPFPIDELSLDGAMLKDLPDSRMLVMIAAAKKDFVSQRLRLFQEAGVKVNILDIDSLALINAFNYTHSPSADSSVSSGAVALVNIGASVTNINILEDGVPHFTRDINVAGKTLGSETMQEAGLVDFVAELRKSFDYYEASSAVVISKIFLSGGGSLISNLSANMKKLLDIEVEQWNVFSNFKFAPDLDEQNIKDNSSQFSVAVGLALR